MTLETDNEGFLLNRDQWSPEIAHVIASRDGYELPGEHMRYIEAARQMFDANGVVPPIRRFTKATDTDKKELFAMFQTGPMKLICKWGGLPKPTGCV